jgi:hypothetical protein
LCSKCWEECKKSFRRAEKKPKELKPKDVEAVAVWKETVLDLCIVAQVKLGSTPVKETQLEHLVGVVLTLVPRDVHQNGALREQSDMPPGMGRAVSKFPREEIWRERA